MKRNKIIAITGGIGSGKTTVSNIIKELGYVVLSADSIYKDLIKKDKIVKKIYTALNVDYDKGEIFNNAKISKIVFEDKAKLKILNDLTHPLIMKQILKESKKVKGVVFNEIPLLFESNLQGLYDHIIIVKRPLEDRLNSVQKRDGASKEEVLRKIKNQFDYENLSNITHTLIYNDKDTNSLKVVVKGVIDEIIKKD